ncbi:unnamed protein product [Urochloa decumbens]|uniref:Uncharacterized protein n=1 Tax=Urochloa decumbens TaxID=240449 RepID=A0ABC9B4X7_9POAL
MKITVHSSKAVKPSYGDTGSAPTAATDTVTLTAFDKVNFDQYISFLYFFSPQVASPPNAVLEQGLAKALAVHRHWAGRFGVDANGDRAIILNDAGVCFVEAKADIALSSLMPVNEPTPALLSLHPNGDGADELMLVQFTRFTCGSVVVGTTAHHLVADAYGRCAFVTAWGNATRGAAAGDPIPAALDRPSVFKPRNPPCIEFDHKHIEFKPRSETVDTKFVHTGDKVVVHRVHFSTDMVSKLKEQASAGAPWPYSTVKCVAAHLWRCITAARGGLAGSDDTATTLKIAVNGRHRMRDPEVPEGYAGNVVLWAHPTTTVGELVSMPLGHVVELVSTAVARIDDGYFRSFVDFAGSGAVEEEGLVPAADPTKMVHCPDVEVYSQVGIPVYDVDFGAGRPFLYMPGYLPEEGLVFILPALEGDGGVDVQVCLFSRAMDVFKSCCYALAEGPH